MHTKNTKTHMWLESVVGELGRGAGGAVYEVRMSDGKTYALKRVFAAELEVLRDLRSHPHPHILGAERLVDIRWLSHATFDVAPYGSLKSVQLDGELLIAHLKMIIDQISSALRFLVYELNWKHGDPHDGNILVFSPVSFKLCDFGGCVHVRSSDKEKAYKTCLKTFYEHGMHHMLSLVDEHMTDEEFAILDADVEEEEGDAGDEGVRKRRLRVCEVIADMKAGDATPLPIVLPLESSVPMTTSPWEGRVRVVDHDHKRMRITI